MTWYCPFCSKEFRYFEVLTDLQHVKDSLAVHLFLDHSHNLTIKDYNNLRKIVIE